MITSLQHRLVLSFLVNAETHVHKPLTMAQRIRNRRNARIRYAKNRMEHRLHRRLYYKKNRLRLSLQRKRGTGIHKGFRHHGS